jgi:aryl-alcohol dehydrogenase-like predicted oxidoreductase
LTVPVISSGTQGFGNYFGQVSDEEAVELIKRAIELGVNHFDCSLCYGDSMSKLALALRDIPREKVIISGRICLHEKRSALQSSLSVYSKMDDIVRDVEEQLVLLDIEYLDALLAHDPSDVEPTLSSNGVLAGMLECKKRGLVHWIGYGMQPHEFHMKVLRTGDVDVMLHFDDYHLLRQTASVPGGILEEASKRNVGVMNGWSILRGLLTDSDISEAVQRGGLNRPDDLRLAQQLRVWAKVRNVSLLAVALQFCLAEPRIHTLPIGSRNVFELEQNVAAVTHPMPKTLMHELDEWRELSLQLGSGNRGVCT